MIFRHVSQPKNSQLCGQACVASLLGVSLEDAIEKVGHSHGTKTKEIASALELTKNRRVRGVAKIPSLISIRRGKERNWHWVLYEGDVVMDPSLPWKVDFLPWFKLLLETGGRITSYLDLTEKWQSEKFTAEGDLVL